MTSSASAQRLHLLWLLLLPLVTSGCSSMGGPETAAPPAAVAAGVIAGAPGPVARPAPAARVEQAPDGVLAGALGTKISDADRKTAFAAQENALTSGQRKTWRGPTGTAYGYVEVGPETPGIAGTCRSYTHTIFFSGRPQSASGQACHAADGVWRSA